MLLGAELYSLKRWVDGNSNTKYFRIWPLWKLALYREAFIKKRSFWWSFEYREGEKVKGKQLRKESHLQAKVKGLQQNLPSQPLKRKQHCWHCDLGLVTSRTVDEATRSVVLFYAAIVKEHTWLLLCVGKKN